MQTPAPTDAELLADWLGHRREPAFHALVERYAGLVHMAAKRTSGDEALAAEASQLTFITLARKAEFLTSRTSLAGWLHLTAVMQAKNLMRKSRRENRKRELLKTTMEIEAPGHSGASWKEMQPVLDDALAALSGKDREALLLRFYRSFSVREIAETLGIATDAAQKRVDRATERLRGKLARRGCQTGGALGATMIAGFASDAQAAVPSVSILTSKAVAAGALATHGTFITILAMKATSFIPPVIALVLAGAWINSQRQTIQALDRQSALLETAIQDRSSSAAVDAQTVSLHASSGQAKGSASMDWNQIADQLAKTGFNDFDQMMFDRRLASMSKEELLDALDEIALLNIPQAIRENLEVMVVFPISKKFPEFAVTRLTERNLGGFCIHHLTCAMELWAQKDFGRAATWMDDQISAGTFATKALDGKNWTRIGYESVLIRTLLTKDAAQLSGRVNQLPADLHKDIIMGVATAWRACGAFEPAEEEAFRKLVREQLPADGQAEVFVERASRVYGGGVPAVDKFLDTIAATPEERLRCVGKVASYWIANIAGDGTVRREDIVGLRDWVGKHVPQAVDRFTGESLGYAVAAKGIRPNGYRKLTYSEAAAFAVEFGESSGTDEVLAAFLISEGGRANRIQSRALAGKISDDTLRAEILKTLE